MPEPERARGHDVALKNCSLASCVLAGWGCRALFFDALTLATAGTHGVRATGTPLAGARLCTPRRIAPAFCGTSHGRDMRPKKTILCVDDSEQILAVRKFLLETRGYRVAAARSGEEAVERFREGGIDLVLGDLLMPGMDGNEMVRQMKEIAPEVPMILISGTVKAFDRANRADAFLPKGASTPVEMLERIRMMIARKRGPKKALRPAFAGPEAAVFAGAEQAIAS